MITKKQQEVLTFIEKFARKHKYAPSLNEIKEAQGLSTPSAAHYHVQKLKNAGYLQKEYNQPRAIATAHAKQTIEIPIVGTIAAGEPIEAIEVPDDTITVTKAEVSKSDNHYALRVRGNSMIDEGIFDGDVVVIRKQETADNGQTVVAVIDDNEATLKKLYRETNRIRLQPANPQLFPIYRDEVEVRGIVVKIIRSFDSQVEKEKASGDKYTRRIDPSWDYRGERTKSYTHGLHTYPAMFIPQVARRLLETHSKKGDTVCDIFCGSGTALVESKATGRNAYGIDLNPLAIFLAKVKTTPINPSKLTKTYFELLKRIENGTDKSVELPSFKNLEFWFKKPVIEKLAKIKSEIKKIKDKDVQDFFMVAFSETVRLASNTKNGEFKLVRMKKEKLDEFNPDVVGIFKKRAEMNIAGMADFYKDADKKTWTKIIMGDSSQDNNIKANSIDFILTSPPYGDSRTTVAYGQFSRLSAQWIDIFENPDEASGVDNTLLGGKPTKDLVHSLGSQYLKEAIEKIEKKDEKRARDVLSFYIGLNQCMEQAHRRLKKNKYFAIVIGNRLVKQVRIPTDYIMAELGENIGFSCDDIFVRNIPGKRMPLKNSPTNIIGALEETMHKESIVILRKTK
jgi:site-specific DNA-methyltransferase (cytosine-N4-specific)